MIKAMNFMEKSEKNRQKTVTNIRILRMCIENFKNHRSLCLEFGGRSVSIFGDNATGKTGVYDALTWLLFGKDSRGNGEKNFEVKPLNDRGEVLDHDALTSVETVFSVDGESLTLKRTYREVWSVQRGSVDVVYDGNTSEYFVDGVPVKKNVFVEKVNELCDEETFRMMTSVSHFADGISWQERRAVLFDLVGVASDGEILASDERFAPLRESMGRLSLDDYKKKLLADKRGYVGAKTDIPARISECQRTIADVEPLDFAAAKAELAVLQAQKESIEGQVLSIERDHASEQKRLEIREAQLDMDRIESENRAFRTSQTAGRVSVETLRDQLSRLRTRRQEVETRLSFAETNVAGLDKDIADSRERWIAVNNERFTPGRCPTCGQALPEAQQKAASDVFEVNKRHRLREIEQTASAKKEARAQLEARIAELKEEIERLDGELAEKTEELRRAEASAVEPVDMVDYSEKRRAAQEKIRGLSEALAELMADTSSAREALQGQLSEVRAEIAKRTDLLSKESLLEYSHKRVEELREDARNASACLDAIERMLYLIDEYTRYKTGFIEESVNRLFRVVRFRLFREQANGGVEDRCDVTVGGVPYVGVNNGAKINAGIDIIHTLSQAYGVRVPLFVDNAESVTKLEQFDGQIIRLIVSENDKELRVEYEN